MLTIVSESFRVRLTLSPLHPFSKIKEMIAMQTNIDIQHQQLTLHTLILPDDGILFDYGIRYTQSDVEYTLQWFCIE